MCPKQSHIANNAAQNPTQNVTATFVARQNTIGNQEGTGSCVICNYAQCDI
jgi:hypothetical protein